MGTAIKRRKLVDALDLLKDQHDKVDALIEQLEGEELEDDQKVLVFRALADNIAAHAAIEERLFYPMVRSKQTDEILLESTEEHLAIKRVLADLIATGIDDERFAARLAVLKEEIQHHAREEEEEVLFPKVRRMFSADDLTALGSEMLALHERLMAGAPRKDIPNQIDKPASI